jgi:hypothetical protein
LPHHQGNDPSGTGATASPEASRQWLKRAFPLDDNHMRPTLLGNILETAVEYPRIAYTMEGLIWWPRLAPLVPGSFQDMLGAAHAPMMGLLNLSIVFTGAAGVGGPMLILVGGHWLAAVITIVGGFLLARLCYRAATSQAMEVANLVKVGFDLYRHDILRQMDLEVPADLDAERALWGQLTAETLAMAPPRQAASEVTSDNP